MFEGNLNARKINIVQGKRSDATCTNWMDGWMNGGTNEQAGEDGKIVNVLDQVIKYVSGCYVLN